MRKIELKSGGEGGIRTPGRSFGPYNGLANRRIQPLCHLSAVLADGSPDVLKRMAASLRKYNIKTTPTNRQKGDMSAAVRL